MVPNTGFVFAIISIFALVYGQNGTDVNPESLSSSSLAPIIIPSHTTDVKTTQPTTTAPSTTTTSPTTPSTTPARTTSAASTTTPAPASTTVAPPSTGHYVVNKDNDTCIIANLAVQLSVEQDNRTVVLDVPQNASAYGSCSNTSQELVLSWSDDDQNNNSLRFVFGQNTTSKRFALLRIDLTYNLGISVLNMSRNKSDFSTPLSKSYRCEQPQEIKLTEDGSNTTYAMLKLSHVQLQAFRSEPNDKFGAAEDCASSSGPDVVPIAVGCALVALVAIVLIAYLVGRKRSQARGYLSM